MPQTVRLSYLFDVTKVEKRNFIQVDGQFDYGRNFKASIIRSNLSGSQFIYFTEYDRWGVHTMHGGILLVQTQSKGGGVRSFSIHRVKRTENCIHTQRLDLPRYFTVGCWYYSPF